MKPFLVALAIVLAAALPAAAPQSRSAPAQETSQEAELQKQAREEAQREQRELAAAYFEIADYDGDGWISFREARSSLEIDRQRYLVYDANQDGQVTLPEYTLVSLETWRRYGAFKPPIPDPDDPTAATRLESLVAGEEAVEEALEYVPAAADSIEELFGTVIPRPRQTHTSPEPDQIVGPVFPYRRLDFDGDGGIGRDDLDVLLLGAGLELRSPVLIAALDRDGDGEISEREFYRAMGEATR